MSKVFGKKARFYIDDEAIYTRSFEMDQGMEVASVDASVFGDDFELLEPIRARGSFSVNARMDNTYRAVGDVADQALDKFFMSKMLNLSTGAVVTTPVNVSAILRNTPAAGDSGVFTRGYGALSFGIPRDGLVSMKFSLTETGPIHNGKVICVQDIPNGSFPFSGTAVAQAGASAGGYMRAALHVVTFELLGGTPSIAFTIETDDNSGFTTPSAARLSFAAVTTKTSEWKEVLTTPGWAGETHVRLKAVLTGGTANVSAVCLVQQG